MPSSVQGFVKGPLDGKRRARRRMDFPVYYRSYMRYTTDKRKGQRGLKVKEIPKQNILNRIFYREIWAHRRVGTEKYLQRSMYQSIYPNFSVTQAEKPSCYLRKFTPDGKYFIAFSLDQTSVEVYTFKGPQAPVHLFVENGHDWFSYKQLASDRPRRRGGSDKKAYYKIPNFEKENIDHISSEDDDPHSKRIRNKIFDSVFKLKYRIPVAPAGEQLNRECSLFTSDVRYLIVGSSGVVDESTSGSASPDNQSNNESLNPRNRQQTDFTLHIVDIKSGTLSHSVSFKKDNIYLSHNQGIYLYHHTLAVLSVQHQTIYLFHVGYGMFKKIRVIGRFCYEDDELLVPIRQFSTSTPKNEIFYSSLKHRLLSYIYRNAYSKSKSQSDLTHLSRFFQYYDHLKNLKIWKMQLLDEGHLLIKYAAQDVVTMKKTEPNLQHCMFIVYDINTTEIIALFENTSEELVDLFENYADSFRNNVVSNEARYCSSPSNNMHSRQIHQKFRNLITSAKFGGMVEATKRILAQLPISAQSFSPSPYLDQALFSYDDHKVSAMERPKNCGEQPIRFYGRDSGLYKFQIHAGMSGRNDTSSQRRLVAFTFHPTAPFAISIIRTNADYFVHFHFRLDQGSFLPLE